jgi:phosphonate transport system substrate-binding protein
VLLVVSCERGKPAKKVSLEKNKKPLAGEPLSESDAVRIAVGAMITPKEGFAYYKKLLDYIGEHLGRDVKFIDRESYAEINALLKAGKIDVAFVCSGPYVDGHEEFGLELLAQPQAYGRTVYYSYIIVPADGEIDSFEQLKGETFAFTDPKSNTGKLVPTYMLAQMGETPDSYFRSYEFTYGHDKSVKAVAQHLVDGAAVDSLIWEYMNKTNPELTSATRIIHKSSPYGIPPIVVRVGIDPELKGKLREILLGVHEDENGREILRGMMIQKFVPGNDSEYYTIRQMKSWIEKNMTEEQEE